MQTDLFSAFSLNQKTDAVMLGRRSVRLGRSNGENKWTANAGLGTYLCVQPQNSAAFSMLLELPDHFPRYSELPIPQPFFDRSEAFAFP